MSTPDDFNSESWTLDRLNDKFYPSCARRPQPFNSDEIVLNFCG